jgi:pilus assembly protein Flp/PilA
MMLSYEFISSWIQARFNTDERGASLVEYALLVALIAVVCIAAVTILGGNARDKFDKVGSSIGQ